MKKNLWFGQVDVTLFVFAIQITTDHPKYRTSHIRIEWNVNRMVLFVVPMRISCCSVKLLTQESRVSSKCFFCDNPKTIITYSGDAMKVPSNLYLYVITAGITNETARYDANTALVHLVNFQIIIWIIVPQITNWKSAAKYHACCIHCKYLFDKISWKLFALSVVTYRFTAADEIVDV